MKFYSVNISYGLDTFIFFFVVHFVFQGLGMRQEFSSDGGRRIVVSQPIIEGLDDVEEEEDGLACMVCREGYTLRPTDMLGVYAFSKRVNLGATSSDSGRGDCVYTTVSVTRKLNYLMLH